MHDPRNRYSLVTDRWSVTMSARDAVVNFIEKGDHENANKALNQLTRVLDAGRKDVPNLVEEIHELRRRLDICTSAKT